MPSNSIIEDNFDFGNTESNQEAQGISKFRFWARLKDSISSLGCYFFAAIIILYVFLSLIAGCTRKPEIKAFSPHLIDEASMIRTITIDSLRKIRFPEGIPVLIKTIDAIPRDEFGKYATRQMIEDPYWDSANHINYLRKSFKFQLPWEKGIFILISQRPQLIQIRYGHKLRLDGYNRGIASGLWYMKNQKYDQTELDTHLLSVLNELTNILTDINDQSGFIKGAKHAGSLVYSYAEDALMVYNNFFTRHLLIPYLRFLDRNGATSSMGNFTLINLPLLVVFWSFGILLIGPMVRKWLKPDSVKIAIVILYHVAGYVVLIVVFAALLLLVRERAEDLLAVQYYGMEHIKEIGFNFSSPVKNGGWTLAIIGGALALTRELFGKLDDAKSGDISIPKKFVVWAVALYMLPMSIGVFFLLYLLNNLIAEIIPPLVESSIND